MRQLYIPFLFFIVSTPTFAQYQYDEIAPSLYDPEYFTVQRDSNNYKVVETYYKKDGAKFNYVRTWEYDKNGNLIEEKALDTLNNYKIAVVCYAPRMIAKYDENNNRIERSFWKNDTTPAFHDCYHIHKEKNVFDKKGRDTHFMAYAINGRLLVERKFEYDSKDRLKKIIKLHQSGREVTGDKSIEIFKHDKEGRIIKTSFRTNEGKKIKDEEKISYYATEYGEDYRIETHYNYKEKVLKKEKITRKGGMAIIEDLLKENK